MINFSNNIEGLTKIETSPGIFFSPKVEISPNPVTPFVTLTVKTELQLTIGYHEKRVQLTAPKNGDLFVSLSNGVARWHIFRTKIPFLGKFWRF
jgi:hypothetical protein